MTDMDHDIIQSIRRLILLLSRGNNNINFLSMYNDRRSYLRVVTAGSPATPNIVDVVVVYVITSKEAIDKANFIYFDN